MHDPFTGMNSQSIIKYFLNTIRLFQTSYQLYDHHLPRFFGVMVIPVFFLFMLNAGLNYFNLTSVMLDNSNSGNFTVLKNTVISIIVGAVVAIVAALLHIALFKMIQANDREERLGVFEVYRQAAPLCGPYLRVILLALVKIVLWSLVLIVPGIVFGFFYSLANIIFIVDGKKGLEALRESKKIIKANGLVYSGNLALMLLVVYLIFRIIDILLANTFGVNEVEGEFRMLAAIGEWLFYLCTIVLSIFPPVFLFYLYKQMRSQVILE